MSTTLAKRLIQDALRDAESFRAMFDPDCYRRWEFAGSVRRRCSEIGDVEHVIIPRFGEVVDGSGLFAQTRTANLLFERLDELVKTYVLTKHAYGEAGTFRWGDKYRGVDYRGFCHELFLATPDNWGPTLAIRTGPGLFSKTLVTSLLRNGRKNEDGHVWANGERISVPNEETYFRLCGVRYREPWERRDDSV